MKSSREYVSPDGLLRLLVVTDREGGIAIGFDGFTWHTHADILAAEAGISEKEAVDRFVQDVICSRAIIALSRINGQVRDAWVTERPAAEARYVQQGESLELRYWDGRHWGGEA